MSYGIQDRQEIQSSIEMDQFERLFFDNLNGDFTEEVQDYNYNSVNIDNFYVWFEMNEFKKKFWIIKSDLLNQSKFKQMFFELTRKLKLAFESKWYKYVQCLITAGNIGCITVTIYSIDKIKNFYHKCLKIKHVFAI